MFVNPKVILVSNVCRQVCAIDVQLQYWAVITNVSNPWIYGKYAVE